MNEAIPYNQTVFIGYCDAAKTVECNRLYPVDAATYYQQMDAMIQAYGSNWEAFDKRTIDLTPYECWQLEKKGNILPVREAISENDFENRHLSIDHAGKLAEQYFERQVLDYMGY